MIDPEDSRYSIMELRREGRAGWVPREIASTSRDGIGLCLVTLAEDRDAAGIRRVPILGVLDRKEGRWVTSLWRATNE